MLAWSGRALMVFTFLIACTVWPVTAIAADSVQSDSPVVVSQADVASLGVKLKAMKLSDSEQEVLRRTIASVIIIGGGIVINEDELSDILESHVLLDLIPLLDAVGAPQTAFKTIENENVYLKKGGRTTYGIFGEDGSPVALKKGGRTTFGIISNIDLRAIWFENGIGLKISPDDVISTYKKLEGLKISPPEREILSHIAACISTVMPSSTQKEGVILSDGTEMLKILGPPEHAILKDAKGLPLVGVFPAKG